MEAEVIVMEVVVGVVNMVLIAMVVVVIGMEDAVGTEEAVVVKMIATIVTVLVHMTVQVVAGVLMMIVIEECGCFGGCDASVKKF